jgi:T5SS/PEP-CTERM-associated repeat protein
VLQLSIALSAFAVDYNWKDTTSGAYNDASRWLPVSPAPPPDSGDAAIFNQNGTYNVTGGGLASVYSVEAGNVTLQSGNFTTDIAGTPFALHVAGGTLNLGANAGLILQRDVAVGTKKSGAAATGTVNINNTATMTLNGNMFLGDQAPGTVTVNSGGALNMSSGSLLTLGSNSGYGQLILLGGQLLRPADSAITVGLNSSGQLEIRQGSQVTDARLRIAQSPSPLPQASEVIVNGMGSKLTVTKELSVALEDLGFLRIQDQGTVQVGGPSVASLSVGGGAVGAGTIELTGASTLDAFSVAATIGGLGQGNLTVKQGSTVDLLKLTLGFAADSSGQFYTSGMGTDVDVTNEIIIGDIGAGDVSIDTNSSVAASSVLIGRQKTPTTGGNGTLNIESGGTLTLTGDLVVGVAGTGFFFLRDDGEIHLPTGRIVLGQESGSLGIFNLYGGAVLDLATNVVVGEEGTGIFNLNDAVQYQPLGGMIVGDLANSLGEVSVDTESSLTVNGPLMLGQFGGGKLMVQGDGTAIANSITLGQDTTGSGTLIVSGGGAIQTSGNLTVGRAGSGAAEVQTGGQLTVTGGNITIGELAGGTGEFTISGGTVSPDCAVKVGVAGSGSFTLDMNSSYSAGSIVVAEQTTSTSEINVTDHSLLQVSGETIIGKQGDANLNLLSGGTLRTEAAPLFTATETTSEVTINVNDLGSTLRAKLLYLSGTTTQQGGSTFLFTFDQGNVYVAETLHTWNFATVNVNVGGSATIGLETPAAAIGSVRVNAQGTLSGTGAVVGNVLNAEGKVAPGNSLGTLTIDGGYTQLASGTLEIGIGGTGPDEFDRLSVTGPIALDGTLNVALANMFTPLVGQSFEILDGTISGAFSLLKLAPLPGTLHWSTATLYTSGELQIVDPGFVLGDFNQDDVVTAADVQEMLKALTDLSVYKSTYILTDAEVLAIGDLNYSGAVTNRDIQSLLNLLAAQGAGSVVAVPEPSAFLLMALTPLSAFVLKRRRASAARIESYGS